ncbi:MAG: hypothetical protein ABI763_13825 [Bacteroidota bacterium]
MAKLVRLCEELNHSAAIESIYSSLGIVRMIIDHIPPIFGFEKFTEVANNYGKRDDSFKKSMRNLENSLRHIANHHLHLTIDKTEVLPTTNQVAFKPDLDLLLSEIVRRLRNNS